MTELEWAEVTRSLTDMFDILMKVAPEKIDGNKVFRAGAILNQELDRIRQKTKIREVFSNGSRRRIEPFTMTSTGIQSESLDVYNAKIEQKKQEIHDIDAGNYMTLEQKLKASIEKVEREKQK